MAKYSSLHISLSSVFTTGSSCSFSFPHLNYRSWLFILDPQIISCICCQSHICSSIENLLVTSFLNTCIFCREIQDKIQTGILSMAVSAVLCLPSPSCFLVRVTCTPYPTHWELLPYPHVKTLTQVSAKEPLSQGTFLFRL